MRCLVVIAILATGCFSKPERPELAADARDVVDDAAAADAPVDLCDDAICATAGGTCVDGACVITRITTNAVTCPSGMPCVVRCGVKDACKAGVFCGGATACEVHCESENACVDKGVDCGTAATCDVSCIGAAACQHGDPGSVRCNGSQCTATCSGSAACENGIAVGTGGACDAHCCNGACRDGTATCALDSVCI
ncbi:MAG TPA: hypothetical protein VFQ53_12610 [Kofleriaceae bacterium]|nr:hypothetical protein [Kofleriaceae bacterium]